MRLSALLLAWAADDVDLGGEAPAGRGIGAIGSGVVPLRH